MNITPSCSTLIISNDTLSDENIDLTKTIIIVTFSSLLGILICVGNILVLLAVATTPSLQNATNYLIVNLACADLCMGVVILPLSTLTYVYSVWPFGSVLCTVWQVLDITLTSASILTLGAISIDRYISLTKPLHYSSIVTTNRTLLSILVVWAWSLGFALPLISQKSSNQNNENPCESVTDVGFVIFSVLVTFYIPSIIVVGMYIMIYRIARAQYKRDTMNRTCTQQQGTSSSNSKSDQTDNASEDVNQSEMSSSNTMTDGSKANNRCEIALKKVTDKTSKAKKETHRIKTENKTLKTLGKVVGLFIFCWLPFFTIYPIGKYILSFICMFLLYISIVYLGFF